MVRPSQKAPTRDNCCLCPQEGEVGLLGVIKSAGMRGGGAKWRWGEDGEGKAGMVLEGEKRRGLGM